MSQQSDAQELIRQHVQRNHDRHVYNDIVTRLRAWRDGRLNDHVNKHVADEFDFELRVPDFLGDMLETVEKMEPSEP